MVISFCCLLSQAVSCGRPGEVVYGASVGTNWTYPNSISFSCQQGFILQGKSISTCQSSGMWSSKPPACIPVNCTSLSKPAYGFLLGSNHSLNASIVFSCQSGYILSGPSVLRCLWTQQWNDSIPSCSPVQCPVIQGPPFATLLSMNKTFKGLARFACVRGFVHTNGSSERQCQADKTWDRASMQCSGIILIYACTTHHLHVSGYKDGVTEALFHLSCTVSTKEMSQNINQGDVIQGYSLACMMTKIRERRTEFIDYTLHIGIYGSSLAYQT